jgi:hypothetical protein
MTFQLREAKTNVIWINPRSALARRRATSDDHAAPTRAPSSPENPMKWRRLMWAVWVATVPGCVTWREIPLPEPPAPPYVENNVTRVRLTTGQSAEFLTLVVATDSLFGIRNNLARTRMSVSFDQVQRVEVRKKDPLRTLGVITLVLVGAAYSGVTGLKPK